MSRPAIGAADLRAAATAARGVGRFLGAYAADRMGLRADPRPFPATPPTASAVTPEWLTAALCGPAPDASVTAVDVLGHSDGTTSRRTLSLTYDRPSTELPSRVFTKSSSSLLTRAGLGLTGLNEAESLFYNHLRPLVDLRSPTGYFASCEPGTGRAIVGLEDLSEKGWTFPDPMESRWDERDAADVVDQLARYHAAFWNGRQAPEALARLQSPLEIQRRLNRYTMWPLLSRVGLREIRSLVPPEIWRRRDELQPAVMRSLELASTGDRTLLHQDLHPGNWLRDPDGRLGLYDWQALGYGSWALDVSYALGGLAVEDRRQWERDLLRAYLEKLREYGVAAPPPEDAAWLCYRQQAMHVYTFTVFTIGVQRLLPDVMQPADYMRHCAEKVMVVLDDLASLDALRG